jgi:hypothetical protein
MSSSSTHPNGGALPPPNYQNSRSRNYVTDSKADLVSMELSEARTQKKNRKSARTKKKMKK